MRHFSSSVVFLVLLLVTAAPSQQLIDARNDNLSYSGALVGLPAQFVVAFRFTATQTTSLTAAQVFTGNSTAVTNMVEIRTRNATTGLPDQLLGQAGSWTLIHSICWQGAAFAQPAPVTAGQDYFVVWRTGMFTNHSVSDPAEPSNVLVATTYSGSGNPGTWVPLVQTPGKFRLYAGGAAGTNSYYGAGKTGQFGVPTIGLQGWPALGNPVDVWLDKAAWNSNTSGGPTGALAVLITGFPIPAGLPIGIVDLYVTPEILTAHLTRLYTNGSWYGSSVTFSVPNDVTYHGLALSFQWAVLDPAAVQGFAHTSAATAAIL